MSKSKTFTQSCIQSFFQLDNSAKNFASVLSDTNPMQQQVGADKQHLQAI